MDKYQEMINRCHAENDAEFEETGGLITTKLAAKIFDKTQQTIQNYIKKKELPAFKKYDDHGEFPGVWYIQPFDMCQFAKKKGWL